jgi:hypothetical protein
MASLEKPMKWKMRLVVLYLKGRERECAGVGVGVLFSSGLVRSSDELLYVLINTVER